MTQEEFARHLCTYCCQVRRQYTRIETLCKIIIGRSGARVYGGHPAKYLRVFFQVAEITAQSIKTVLVGMVIAVVKEFMITFVEAGQFPGMLDRAPVLFRSGCYLLDIGDQAVEVTAVYAVYFFNGIQIAETLAVQHYIIASFYSWDTVYPETYALIS